ncbi:MAG: lactonase family protein, partial [Acidobacteria bacterium]|nr:lactonase family protein [Acidobacteriota bacterium]
KTGSMRDLKLAAKTTDPTFLAIHPTRPLIYSVVAQPEGKISAFAVEADGSLRLLNQVSSKGAGPAHVQIDRTGQWVSASNYGSGSFAVYRIEADGKLSEATDSIQHEKGERAPHAHFSIFSPDNKTIYVNDLGLDQAKRYAFDNTTGKIKEQAPLVTPKGAGPRHLVLGKKKIYVLNELASSVSVFENDKLLETVSALPAGFTGKSSAAEIVTDKNEKFIYSSNRGADTIAIFKTGKTLTKIADQKVGRIPRGFVISPDGKFMLVGSQDDNTIQVYSIDSKTGLLTASGKPLSAPFPICLRFARK